MDKNAIDLALNEIQCMLSVAIDAAETMTCLERESGICQISYEKHNLLDFSLFDLEKRVKALRQQIEGN